MSGGNLHTIAERIRSELIDLERVVYRIAMSWERAVQEDDEFCLDSVAFNLYGFSAGLERIFIQIGEVIDGDLPGGEDSHLSLLNQMTRDNPPVRPPVVSASVGERLEVYGDFRQLVYDAHAYRFYAPQMEPLVMSAPDLFAQLKAELSAFAASLEG